MDAVTAVFNTLGIALSLWKDERAHEFERRRLRLQEAYYEEKRRADPNMALLDDLEHQLFLLCSTFGTATTSGPQVAVQH